MVPMANSWIKHFRSTADGEFAIIIGFFLEPLKTWVVLWKVPPIKPRPHSLTFNWTHIARGQMLGN